MYRAQKLPLRGAHFRAGLGAAWWRVEKEAHNQRVALCNEKAAELIEPKVAIDGGRGSGEDEGGLSGDRLRVVRSVMVMERGKVLLQLESRVELEIRSVRNSQTTKLSRYCASWGQDTKGIPRSVV